MSEKPEPRTIDSKRLRLNLSDTLSDAKKGQEITVTRHGQPVAVIGPPPKVEQ